MSRCVLLGAVVLLSHASLVGAAEPEGARVFQQACSHCHAASNEKPGTLQLGRTRGVENAVLTERTNLSQTYVKTIVRQGLKAMPAFVPTDISETELAALARFLAPSNP
jgi:mono/diheme cytochrome c family protein